LEPQNPKTAPDVLENNVEVAGLHGQMMRLDPRRASEMSKPDLVRRRKEAPNLWSVKTRAMSSGKKRAASLPKRCCEMPSATRQKTGSRLLGWSVRVALPKLGRLLPYLPETVADMADIDVQRPEPDFDGFYVWQSYNLLRMQAKQGYKSKKHLSKVSLAKRKKRRSDYSKQARTKRTNRQKAADAARQSCNCHRRMANEPADSRGAWLKKQLEYATAYQASRRNDPKFKRRKSENGLQYCEKNGEELRARKREPAAARADETNRRRKEARHANLDENNTKHKEYYAANRERLKANQREYREANKERLNAKQRERSAAAKAAKTAEAQQAVSSSSRQTLDM
jgi:hypothetical protein